MRTFAPAPSTEHTVDVLRPIYLHGERVDIGERLTLANTLATELATAGKVRIVSAEELAEQAQAGAAADEQADAPADASADNPAEPPADVASVKPVVKTARR